MKFLTVPLLIACILSKTIYGFYWQVKFHINQKEIIAKSCINKNNPMRNCNGQCYLAKQLQKAEIELDEKKQHQENSSIHFKSLKSPEFIAIRKEKIVPIILSFKTKSAEDHFKNNYWKSITPPSIFHPPCC
jgi:hypothetical protein